MYALQSIINYYVCGHTAKGKVCFLEKNLQGIQKRVILKHPSIHVKSKVLKQLIKILNCETIESISSPLGKEYLDGIIMHEKSLAFLTEDIVGANLNGVTIINLEEYIGMDFPGNKGVFWEVDQLLNKAYTYFSKGLAYHLQLEKIYINEMDFKKADKIAVEFIAALFEKCKKKPGNAVVKERLFGTNTPDGIVNHLEDLIEPFEKRIYVKGRAGTGKSVFMKRVLKKSIEFGFDVEVYHCSFDPESLDMVIIRELNCCLFDSTAPHEFFPTRNTDVIIDLYELTVTPGTEEKYAKEINDLVVKYKQEMKNGIDTLAEIKPLLGKVRHDGAHLSKEDVMQIVDEIGGFQ